MLTAGQLPALRELDLNVGLLGYGRLCLGAATCLTRLAVDSVEYVDLRYTEVRTAWQRIMVYGSGLWCAAADSWCTAAGCGVRQRTAGSFRAFQAFDSGLHLYLPRVWKCGPQVPFPP